MTQIPSITLRDGKEMPQLGFGVWGISPNETPGAVVGALEAGYRLIDGAFIYKNEAEMGQGIRDSGLPRDEVFITTKVWNSDHGKENARKATERSLEAVGVDYLDLMLIHWPLPHLDLYVETWEALIDMRNEGLIRSIGVSNFNKDHLERIISETGETPTVNQIEMNPKLQQPQMRDANAALGIQSEAWTPLGKNASFEEKPIQDAAKRTGKTPAQIVLRWHMQLGNIAITRSSNPQRRAENLDIFDFELTSAEMAAIATLDIGLRCGPDPTVFKFQ